MAITVDIHLAPRSPHKNGQFRPRFFLVKLASEISTSIGNYIDIVHFKLTKWKLDSSSSTFFRCRIPMSMDMNMGHRSCVEELLSVEVAAAMAMVEAWC